ncbi:hypothetical protein [Streptomyces sp. NRRL S-237]|uniref:hypothetical protein n=1 Tax=Streptomyces sp. NRRL S-237 TaxID=1463895 RepID=UPI0004CAF110|nr:hypothetical protein [Streptomyces sp. NRRL S-237]
MTLLTEYRTPARPDRRLVEVYDADAHLVDGAAIDLARRHVVGGNGYHLYLSSLQPDITVEVTIRVWDAPRRPPADVEGTLPVEIESETGILVVGQFTFGPAGQMTLPRPGVYEGHASWSGRVATAAYYDDVLRRIDSDHGPEWIGRAWEQNPVPERYTLDLWFVREPEPDPDEDEDEEEE